MKALFFNEHGSVENLLYGELPEPAVGEGQVLIEVKAAALNHLDLWVLGGWRGLELELPHVGGADIAGLVAEASQGGGFSVGDRVLVQPGFVNGPADEWTRRGEDSVSPSYRIFGEEINGGFAEYVAVPEDCVYHIAQGKSFEQACAPLLVGLTAWRMLVGQAGIKKNDTVLIVGAGGGLNSFAIQLAKLYGATVIALTSTEAKEERALKLGASIAINYRQRPDWAKDVSRITEGRGVDIVVDNVGAETFPNSLKAARRGGCVVTVGNTSGPILQIDNRYIFSKQLRIIGSSMGSKEDFRELLKILEKDQLAAIIDRILPLEEGKTGYKLLEVGEQFGKIVFSI